MKSIEELKNKIIEGDCLEVMKEIPDNSIDTIITDPPYALGFMGKEWDNDIAFNPKVWKEALRVAKPGATLLCFGGTRTWHRLACAIEDAGWIIKDTIMWIYGQGFPKSTDISKQIDKQSGMERKVVGIRKSDGWRSGKTSSVGQYLINYGPYIPITEPATPEAKLWNGWHSHGLKPAYEPIIVAMKPNDGSYAENALKWGVSGLNIEEARISYKNDEDKKSGQSARPSLTKDTMFSMGGLDRSQRDNIQGRYPANIILDEESAKELDRQSGISKSIKSGYNWEIGKQGNVPITKNIKSGVHYSDIGGASRFFYVAKASRAERNAGCEGWYEIDNSDKYNGKFPCSKADRFKNNHPTVKPIKLMEYLCILTKTPTGGIILDPFVGSGTTCIAAIKTGRDFIGIEKEPEYVRIAEARINYWKQKNEEQNKQQTLL